MSGFTGARMDGKTGAYTIVRNGEVVYAVSVDKDVYISGEFTNPSIATWSGEAWGGSPAKNAYALPASRPCAHCGTRGGENEYHAGTCGNCGAVL